MKNCFRVLNVWRRWWFNLSIAAVNLRRNQDCSTWVLSPPLLSTEVLIGTTPLGHPPNSMTWQPSQRYQLSSIWIQIGCPRHCRVFGALLDAACDLLFSCRNYPYNVPNFVIGLQFLQCLFLGGFIGTRTRNSTGTTSLLLGRTPSLQIDDWKGGIPGHCVPIPSYGQIPFLSVKERNTIIKKRMNNIIRHHGKSKIIWINESM